MRVKLEIIKGPQVGRTFECTERGIYLVGRSFDAAFQLSQEDPYVSRKHFQLEINPFKCIFRDLNSTNPPRVNNMIITYSEIHDGDIIQVGYTQIKVNIDYPNEYQFQCKRCGSIFSALRKEPYSEFCPSCVGLIKQSN